MSIFGSVHVNRTTAGGADGSVDGGVGLGGLLGQRLGYQHDKIKSRLPSLKLSHAAASSQMENTIMVGSKPLIVRSDVATDSQRLGQLQPGRLLTVLRTERDEAGGGVRACVALDDSHDREAIDSWRQIYPGKPRWKYEEEEVGGGGGLYRFGSPPRPSGAEGSPRVALGWITIEKDGKGLVQKRSKLNAHQRQQHLQQWARRLAADKNFAAARPNADRRIDGGVGVRAGGSGGGGGAGGGWRARRGTDAGASRRPKSIFLRELEADTEGFGFAYGGVEPGRLRAHGNLVEWHKVAYSIGLCGRYLLHVGLRQQSTPLPGSPFRLEVTPGPAHALATRIPEELLPLRGRVVTNAMASMALPPAAASAEGGAGGAAAEKASGGGGKGAKGGGANAPGGGVNEAGDEKSDGCHLILHAADKMGNLCTQGGANVTCSCKNPAVESSVVDLGNGKYRLEWRSRVSGLHQVQIQIDGLHVIGSPALMRLSSGTPDVLRTKLSGEGLTSAIAGKVAHIKMQCVDSAGNPTLPGSQMRFGLALLPTAAAETAWRTAEAHPFEVTENVELEQLELRYVANEAGEMSLHLWAELDVATGSSPAGSGGGDVRVPAAAAIDHEDAAAAPVAAPTGGRSGGKKKQKAKEAAPKEGLHRLALPGSPFMLHVLAARANNSGSYIDGVSREMEEKVEVVRTAGEEGFSGAQSRVMAQMGRSSASKEDKASHQYRTETRYLPIDASEPVPAGNIIMIRPQIRDPFGNAAAVPDGALSIRIETEEGVETLPCTPQMIKGLWNYDMRYELRATGRHVLHVLLSGSPINGSPVTWYVKAGGPFVNRCRVLPPSGYFAEKPLTANTPYVVTAIAVDKYGRDLEYGGAVVACTVKASGSSSLPVGQATTFPVEDLGNGTYLCHVNVIGSADVKLIVAMDKDRAGYPGGGEIAPLSLSFTKMALAKEPTPGHPAAAQASPPPQPGRQLAPTHPHPHPQQMSPPPVPAPPPAAAAAAGPRDAPASGESVDAPSSKDPTHEGSRRPSKDPTHEGSRRPSKDHEGSRHPSKDPAHEGSRRPSKDPTHEGKSLLSHPVGESLAPSVLAAVPAAAPAAAPAADSGAHGTAARPSLTAEDRSSGWRDGTTADGRRYFFHASDLSHAIWAGDGSTSVKASNSAHTSAAAMPPAAEKPARAPASAPPLVLAMPAISKVREIDLGVSGAIREEDELHARDPFASSAVAASSFRGKAQGQQKRGGGATSLRGRKSASKANGSKSAGASLGCVAETTSAASTKIREVVERV